MAKLRNVDDLVVPDLERSLATLPDVKQDAPLIKLARLYARQIDRAADVAAALDLLLSKVEAAGEDAEHLFREIQVMQQQIESTRVLNLLGPKLRQVLNDLLLSPVARIQAERGVKPATDKKKPQARSGLALVREARGEDA